MGIDGSVEANWVPVTQKEETEVEITAVESNTFKLSGDTADDLEFTRPVCPPARPAHLRRANPLTTRPSCRSWRCRTTR